MANQEVSVTFTDVQEDSFTLAPQDQAGNATAIPVTASSSDESIATVEMNSDNLGGKVSSTGKEGTCDITLTGTNPDNTSATTVVHVTVVASDVNALNATFADPSDKAPAEPPPAGRRG